MTTTTYAEQAGYQASVTHPDIPASIEWDKMEGGGLTHSSSKFRSTARGKRHVQGGDSERENITTECYVDPVAHSRFIAQCHAEEKFEGAVLQKVYLDSSGVARGEPLRWTGCQVAKFDPPSGDANSEDMAKIVLEWVCP